MRTKLFIAALVLAVSTLCAKDLKTVVFSPNPPMSCQNCENKIKGNIRFEKGVKDIQTDLESQQIIITYDADKTTEEKLADALDKIGYEVTPSYCGTSGEQKCDKAAKKCDKSKNECNNAKKECNNAKKECDKSKKCCKSAEEAQKCETPAEHCTSK